MVVLTSYAKVGIGLAGFFALYIGCFHAYRITILNRRERASSEPATEPATELTTTV